MTGIHVTQSFDTRSQFLSRMRPRKRTPLPELDHLQLQHHLEQCERFRQPAWRLLACVLRDKIKMTDPVSDPPRPRSGDRRIARDLFGEPGSGPDRPSGPSRPIGIGYQRHPGGLVAGCHADRDGGRAARAIVTRRRVSPHGEAP